MSKRTVRFYHGWNVWDGGAATVGKLVPWFAESWNTAVHPYKLFGIFFTKWRNNSLAKKFAKSVERGDIGVGHSNGCAILTKMVEDYSAPFKGLIFINPALDSEHTVPNVDFVLIYHSEHDIPTKIAALIPRHPWGSMGNEGYTGDAPNHLNFDENKHQNEVAHSDVFRNEMHTEWAPRFVSILRKMLKTYPD